MRKYSKRSKTEIEHFYLKDFERAKDAGLGEFDNVVDIHETEGGSVGSPIAGPFKDVECVLENLATRRVCKVTYSLSTKDWTMVKHYIHWINPMDTGVKKQQQASQLSGRGLSTKNS